jgi:hypothetical protein
VALKGIASNLAVAIRHLAPGPDFAAFARRGDSLDGVGRMHKL